MKKMQFQDELLGRAEKVCLLLMDCDGVLTDGRLYFSARGEELKAFHVHDGQGIKLWHQAGFRSGIITGRGSEIVLRRSEELGIDFVIQNSIDKVADCKKILMETGNSFEEVAYIGDDLSDKALLKSVGFPVLVSDAAISFDESFVRYTSKDGGSGAVRDVVNFLLNTKRK